MCPIKVSIIIPTYNRKDLLLSILHSLTCQTFPFDSYEVVVVDDGSTDDTREIVNEVFPYFLLYIKQTNQGSASARNTGAKQARGDLLIFLDDDMLVNNRYIEGLAEEHQRYPRIIGMAKHQYNYLNNASLFERIYTPLMYSWEYSIGLDGSFVDFTRCETNNLSVEQSSFFELGMMQDIAGDGPTWWGDIDFGYRAHKAGFKFRISGLAICSHIDYSYRSLRTACLRAYKASKYAVLLFVKYPDLQNYMHQFLDLNPINWKQDGVNLILKKTFHIITSKPPVNEILESLVQLVEIYAPYPKLLSPLYRWILSSYIYRGYHDGLVTYRHL